MNYRMVSVLIFFFAACAGDNGSTEESRKQIDTMLDSWHKAAADADYRSYFNHMADESIFIGTDATENWNKNEFMVWAKPYFDKGKAWSFTKLERNLFFDETGHTAWFDELLNTQMKICRGSGVLIKTEQGWKIKHYVLSMTFPNDSVDAVINIKAPIEDRLIESISSK